MEPFFSRISSLEQAQVPMNRISIVALAISSLSSFATAEPWTRHTIDDTSKGADGVRFADANGDGLPDIATGWEEGGLVRVYLNPGPVHSKKPWANVTVGTVKSPEDAVFADLDQDGNMDVISSCEGKTQTLFVHWAPSEKHNYLDSTAWKTEAIPCTKKLSHWMFALPKDVDGENGIDLIVGSKNGSQLGWLQSPNNPREMHDWKYHPLQSCRWIMSLIEHDMDGDGDGDIVVTDRVDSGNGVYWLKYPGVESAADSAAWTRHNLGPAKEKGATPMFAHVTKNTPVSLTVAIRPNYIHTWSFDSAGNWRDSRVQFPSKQFGKSKAVSRGDINLDGLPDLVVSCGEANGAKSGLFMIPSVETDATDLEFIDISGPVGLKYDLVELIDLDADGDLDILTCEERDLNAVVWYENPTR